MKNGFMSHSFYVHVVRAVWVPPRPPLSGALGTQATSAFGSGLLGQRLGTPCGEIRCPMIGGGIKQRFNKWLFKVGFGRNRVLYSPSSRVYSHRSRFLVF